MLPTSRSDSPQGASPPPAATIPPADADLVARLRRGDEAAYDQLVRLHGGRLLAVARRLLRNEADAADAVQDAFLSAFKSIGTFAGDAQVSTWLHRIVVNAALMRLRARGRRPEESLEEHLPKFLDDGHHASPPSAWAAAADDLIQQDETRALVRRCIDQLPETHRTVLILRDIEEMDTEEAAAALGVNTNVIKVRLHRARQALRSLLDPHMREVRS